MQKRFVCVLAPAVAFVLALPAAAEDNAAAILGPWLTTDKTSIVEVYEKDGQYFGKITWLEEPRYGPGDPDAGEIKHDRNNPDEGKQDRPIKGLEVLKGFTYDADDEEWSGGTIYDPANGKTYKCQMHLEDEETLNVRGYIGVPLFGRTETWTRPAEEHPALKEVEDRDDKNESNKDE